MKLFLKFCGIVALWLVAILAAITVTTWSLFNLSQGVQFTLGVILLIVVYAGWFRSMHRRPPNG